MRAEILSVGTELLVGSILNTNAQFLSQRLAERGIDVFYQATVGDNVARLSQAIRTALERSDIVLCSGGLGPTEDDITMEAAAQALGLRRVFSQETASFIRRRLRAAGYPISKLSLNQCRVPEGSALFQNENGTAPGILIQTQSGGETKFLALLPGPPAELEPLFLNQIWPAIAAQRKSAAETFFIRTVKITGLTETEVAERLGDILRLKPPVTCGIYAKPGEVQLKIMSKAQSGRIARSRAALIEKRIRRLFGGRVFGADEDSLASVVLSLLKKRGHTLALAESCTGGLATHLLTEVPGSSQVLVGSIIAYSNQVKRRLLGVRPETLQKWGAVSAQTAVEMARGARLSLQSTIGIGITGIAGPGGGTRLKQAGLVFVAVATQKNTCVRKFRFIGSRTRIKQKSALAALDLIRSNGLN